jgi:steroid delta-isomerase-like uncharacterized protein
VALPNKTVVRRLYQEVWNERKLEVADELISPSHALVDPNAADGETGPEAYKAQVMRLVSAFPDLKFKLQDMICEKDKVVAAWTISGTHKGEYKGIEPTDKKVLVEGITIHQIADGKILDSLVSWDTLGLLKKIGGVITVEKVAVAGAGKYRSK